MAFSRRADPRRTGDSRTAVKSLRRTAAPASWSTLALLIVGYGAAVWVGLNLVVEPPRVSIFWPATGLAFAGLILTPHRQWGILLGAWFAIHVGSELWAGYPIGLALAYPTIALSEAALGAWLIRRSNPAPITLSSRREVLLLVGSMGLVAAPISATAAALVQSMVSHAPGFWMSWRVWWTSELLGELVVAPPILTAAWVARWWRGAGSRRRIEVGVALIALALLSEAILGVRPAQASIALCLLALPYPLFVWLALRAGAGGVSIAMAAVSAIAAWQTIHGVGPFMVFHSNPVQQVLIIQIYLASVVIPSLFLAAAAHEAQEAMARVREIYDNSSEAIFLVGVRDDDEFVYEALNPLAEAAFGPRAHSAIGHTVSEVLPAEVATQVAANFRRCLKEHKPVSYESTFDLGQGEVIWQTSLAPIRDTAGGIRRIAGFARDVTERRQSERARAALEQQLRQAQKMEALGRLAGGLAHEFNNILTAMIGHAELADAKTQAGTSARDSLGAIREGGTRAATLVRQVLTFSRRQEQPRQSLRLQDMVEEAMRLVRATVPSTIDLRQSIDTTCPPVLADPTQVHQALINLVSNATYSMRDRKGVLEISLAPVEVGSEIEGLNAPLPSGLYACLTVSDTGPGMTPQMLEHIFEPFYTTKPVGEGTGLGLPVVLGIMQSHEGGIAVTSRAGQGTTVRLFFPTLPAGTGTTDWTVAAPPRGAGERVLFVDDEPSIVQLGEQLLVSLGYSPVALKSPEAVLAMLRETPDGFDAVITDLTMPGMTGVELAAELKRSHPGLPVVIATGAVRAPSGQELESAGVREVLSKPYSYATLGHVLGRLLGKTAE
jgi:PAS domain S-box-containing protein